MYLHRLGPSRAQKTYVDFLAAKFWRKGWEDWSAWTGLVFTMVYRVPPAFASTLASDRLPRRFFNGQRDAVRRTNLITLALVPDHCR